MLRASFRLPPVSPGEEIEIGLLHGLEHLGHASSIACCSSGSRLSANLGEILIALRLGQRVAAIAESAAQAKLLPTDLEAIHMRALKAQHGEAAFAELGKTSDAGHAFRQDNASEALLIWQNANHSGARGRDAC
jgi:hypothetical protein